MKPRVSIVVPVYEEGEHVLPFLERVIESVQIPFELLAVYDSMEDSTRPYLEKYAEEEPRVRPTLNTYGRGPARAIRFGMDAAEADVIVVTMADGSDDPAQIEEMVRLVERGVVIAAGSRYARGGRQVGGPAFKGFLSRMAGLSLYWLARVGTRDATNSFKAYDRSFIREVGVHSSAGFELGIELVAKAKRLGRPVGEVPTTWVDREAGDSNFKLAKWLPKYVRWYAFAFGPNLTSEQLRERLGSA